MYVDLTPEFRLVVSSLSSRAEELGISVTSKNKSRILGEKVRRPSMQSVRLTGLPQSGLRRQAEKIVLTVRSLSELLREQRDRYLDATTGVGAMSETERNQVDAGAEEIARQCHQLISRYRESLLGLEEEQREEAREHHEAVCEGLERMLKGVVGTHSEMRAVRVSRHLQMKKLSRLEVTSVESRAREIGGGQSSHTVSLQVSKQVYLNKIFQHFKYNFLCQTIKNSQRLIKLNPMKSPSTPPTSATKDPKEKAFCSFSMITLLLENMIVRFVWFGATV